MRSRIARLGLVLFAAMSIVPMATPANAMTCEINDGGHIDPSPGDAACDVFLKVVAPVCAKFGCG